MQLVMIFASGWGVRVDDESDLQNLYIWAAKTYRPSCPMSEIIYRTEDAPWRHVARRLAKVATEDCVVIFVGHSFGCGEGYHDFELEWRKLGRVVTLVILIDPVSARVGFLIRAILAFTTYPSFKVVNAREVLAFRQVNRRPLGEAVRVRDGVKIRQISYGGERALARRRIGRGRDVILDAEIRHDTIDGDPRVVRVVRRKIRTILQPMSAAICDAARCPPER